MLPWPACVRASVSRSTERSSGVCVRACVSGASSSLSREYNVSITHSHSYQPHRTKQTKLLTAQLHTFIVAGVFAMLAFAVHLALSLSLSLRLGKFRVMCVCGLFAHMC